MNLAQARSNMIEQQVRPWDVLDQRVLDVLAGVPREAFVDEANSGIAYSDYPLPIGHGQHMFKPTLDGRLLQALALAEDSVVLEIGTGSGYLTACIAKLAMQCDSLEINETLAAAAIERLTTLEINNARVMIQDAAAPWDSHDTYDAILFGGSVATIPDRYRRLMNIGGHLVAIVGSESQPAMEAMLLTRVNEEEWAQESLFKTRVDPLRNFSDAPAAFDF